jgi:hypothetical protein
VNQTKSNQIKPESKKQKFGKQKTEIMKTEINFGFPFSEFQLLFYALPAS